MFPLCPHQYIHLTAAYRMVSWLYLQQRIEFKDIGLLVKQGMLLKGLYGQMKSVLEWSH
jgi:hypothetical protein